MITCAFCNKPIEDTKYKTHKRKKYHYSCFDVLLSNAESENQNQERIIQSGERKHLEEYICDIFQLEKVPYLIEKQISDYIQNGFSTTGIEKTLYYFYALKNGKIDKETPSIGIVPYVYEEAKQFYQKAFEINQENQEIKIENQNVVVKIKPQNRLIPYKTKIEEL